MKRSLVALALPLLLAAAPVPLIAGAVRDQLGRPIVGAVVIAGDARTITAADGTFALQSGERAVRIECRYCQPATVPVSSDGTVTALVARYTALERSIPSPEDISALPLSHAQQILSLTPYAVVFDTTAALPGPRVALYGSRSGGLVVDSGVASYDTASGSSSFRTIPGFDVASVDMRDVEDAPRYGDLAAGGIFDFSAIAPQNAGTFLTGNERAARASVANGNTAFALGTFGDPFENASRADARYSTAGDRYGSSVNVFSARDAYTDASLKTLSSSMSALAATVTGPGSDHPYVQFAADRAGYTLAPLTVTGLWSDISAQGGMRTDGNVSFFADAGGRFSSALYSYGTYGVAEENGSERQTRIDAGAAAQTGIFSWQAIAATIDVDTSTNGYLASSSQHAALIAPSLDVDAQLAPQWNFQLTAAESLDIPPLLERYYYSDAAGLALQRVAIERASLSFSDLRRINVGITATHENYTDADPQSALGLSAAWQIAPDISLRAWTLNFGDDAHVYAPATAWLAYRSRSGATADVIWQRQLLNYRPQTQLSASIALPVSQNLNIFAGTEALSGRRLTTVGLRLSP